MVGQTANSLFVDDAGAVEALGISWRLTRGRWWRGTVILTYLDVDNTDSSLRPEMTATASTHSPMIVCGI